MRELYLIGCGLVLGVYLADFLQAYERRLAHRAADLADEWAEARRKHALDCTDCGTGPGIPHQTWCSKAPAPAPTPAAA